MNEVLCKSRLLQLACIVSGVAAFISLLIAVTSTNWLHTIERMRIPEDEVYTEEDNVQGEGVSVGEDVMPAQSNYIPIETVSGMWRICIVHPGEDDMLHYLCRAIVYRGLFNERIPGTETTFSIIRAARLASFSVVFSLGILVAGLVCATVGRFMRNNLAIVGSVVLVMAGLLLTLGLVLYARAVSDEVGYRKPSKGDVPAFEYWYGSSFCFAAIALVSTNVVAVANVYLHQRHYLKLAAPSSLLPPVGTTGSDVSYEQPIVIA